jgi:hypothetical protein
MTEPLTGEEKANLLESFDPARVAAENAASKKPKKVTPTHFSRPPVVVRSPAVYKPSGWFPNGQVDKAGK